MKQELRLFLTSVMFYTRIPVPKWVGYSDDNLNRSLRYFPLIGWLVGGVICGSIYVLQLALPLSVAVICGIALGVLTTGAFHEDGFADLCDGFGGGMGDRQRTLDIMKDSRVGAFAAIGLVLLFALKLATMISVLDTDLWLGIGVVLFAHVLSRWCVVTLVFTHEYARDDLTSKVKPIGRSISGAGLAVSFIWLLPFVAWFWHTPWLLTAIVPAYLVKALLGGWFKRRLGGYTGDCCGAAQQIIELVTMLFILGLWTFI